MNEFLHSLRSNTKDKRYNRNHRRSNEGNHYNRDNNRKPYNARNQQNNNYEKSAINQELLESVKSYLENIVVNQNYLLETSERKAVAEERKATAMESIAVSISKMAGISSTEIMEELKSYEPVPPVKRVQKPSVQKGTEKEITQKENNTQQVAEEKKVEVVQEKPIEQKQEKPVEQKQEKPVEQKQEKSIVSGETDRAKSLISMSKEEVMDEITKMRNEGSTYDQIANYLTEQKLPTFSGRGSWHAQTIHRLYQKS